MSSNAVLPTEILGRHHFAGRGLHQRRATQEDGALVAHDHRFVAHRRHVCAACGAGSEHRGDLRDALRAEIGLVVEDSAEVVAIGKHLVLPWQERASGVDEVNARQAILRGDLLGAQMLLDRNRIVGATFDRRVVGDDHALATGDPADAGDDAGAGTFIVVHPVGGQRCDLEEGTTRIEQAIDAVAREQLAAIHVTGAGTLRATECGRRELAAQLPHEGVVRAAVLRR